MQVTRSFYVLIAAAILLSLCVAGCLDSVDSEGDDDSQLELLSLSGSESAASINSTVIHSLKLINHAKHDQECTLKYSSSLGLGLSSNLKANPFTMPSKSYVDKLEIDLKIPNNGTLIGQTDVTTVWLENEGGSRSTVIEFRTEIGPPPYMPPVLMSGYVKFINRSGFVHPAQIETRLSAWGGWVDLLDNYGNVIDRTAIAAADAPEGMFSLTGLPENATSIRLDINFTILSKSLAGTWVLYRVIESGKTQQIPVPWYDNPDIQSFDVDVEIASIDVENRRCDASISRIKRR